MKEHQLPPDEDDDSIPLPVIKKKPFCELCGSTDMTTQKNIGSDIDESGSEEQHLQHCKCGASRLYVERYQNFSEYVEIFGKWKPPVEDWFPDYL